MYAKRYGYDDSMKLTKQEEKLCGECKKRKAIWKCKYCGKHLCSYHYNEVETQILKRDGSQGYFDSFIICLSCERRAEQEQKLLKWWRECKALKDQKIISRLIAGSYSDGLFREFTHDEELNLYKELEKLLRIIDS